MRLDHRPRRPTRTPAWSPDGRHDRVSPVAPGRKPRAERSGSERHGDGHARPSGARSGRVRRRSGEAHFFPFARASPGRRTGNGSRRPADRSPGRRRDLPSPRRAGREATAHRERDERRHLARAVPRRTMARLRVAERTVRRRHRHPPAERRPWPRRSAPAPDKREVLFLPGSPGLPTAATSSTRLPMRARRTPYLWRLPIAEGARPVRMERGRIPWPRHLPSRGPATVSRTPGRSTTSTSGSSMARDRRGRCSGRPRMTGSRTSRPTARGSPSARTARPRSPRCSSARRTARTPSSSPSGLGREQCPAPAGRPTAGGSLSTR